MSEKNFAVEIFANLPPVPDGQMCEFVGCPVDDDWEDAYADIEGTVIGWFLGNNPQPPPHGADTTVVRFGGYHACYLYVCDRAAEERGTDDDFDEDWPRVDGEPVEPTRCC